MDDPSQLDTILSAGAERARSVAVETVDRTRDALGFLKFDRTFGLPVQDTKNPEDSTEANNASPAMVVDGAGVT